MEEPDPRTVRQAADGDLDAFAELVRSTQPDVWRFIRHLVRDDELAADLTQDTYLRVHRSIGGFRGDSRFRTWLFAIARNIVVDHHRQAGRRGPVASIDRDGTGALAATDARAPLHTELRAALDDLPLPQRSAFVLVEVFGLRYREAADVLDLPEGTVKSRVFHARAALVRWFDAEPTQEHDHG